MNADRTSPSETFPALVLDRSGDELHCTFQQLSESDLPPGDVLVEVTHSSVNYKDGLAVTGKGKIARSFPMVPGIDLAGTVLRSESAEYRPGDRVLATGYGMSETRFGGYSARARLEAGSSAPHRRWRSEQRDSPRCSRCTLSKSTASSPGTDRSS